MIEFRDQIWEDVRSIPSDRWDRASVAEIMTEASDLVTVTVQDDAAETMTKLQQRGVRQLSLMRNGPLAGLLLRRDLVKWLQLYSEGGL